MCTEKLDSFRTKWRTKTKWESVPIFTEKNILNLIHEAEAAFANNSEIVCYHFKLNLYHVIYSLDLEMSSKALSFILLSTHFQENHSPFLIIIRSSWS